MQHRPITIISFARAVTVRVCVSTVVEVCAISSMRNIALLALVEVLAYFTCTLAVLRSSRRWRPASRATLGMLPGLALIYKHVVVNKSGPPAPVMWLTSSPHCCSPRTPLAAVRIKRGQLYG